MNNDDYTIICSRCGSEMKISSRCCMKCGSLNPEHPDNKGYEKYFNKNKNSTYSVGDGKKIYSGKTNSNVVSINSENIGSSRLCFFLNFLLYVGSIILISYYFYVNNNSNFDGIINSDLYVYLISISVFFIIFYSYQLLFMCLDRKWWYSLIPVYNNMVLCKCIFNKKWLGLVMLVPIVGQILGLVLLYKLARSFKCSWVLMILFPFVMIPVVVYGGYSYNDTIYVNNEKFYVEKSYKRKKMFLRVCMIVIIIGIVLRGLYLFS